MRWSEAVEYVWNRAEELKIRDEWGDLLSGQEVMAMAVPRGSYDALLYELEAGLMTPETYIDWNMAYLDAFARKRIRKKAERYLNSIPHKIPNAGSVKP
jgi:hypothetical protein